LTGAVGVGGVVGAGGELVALGAMADAETDGLDAPPAELVAAGLAAATGVRGVSFWL
jgi:uncharacterized OsmC-like protein